MYLSWNRPSGRRWPRRLGVCSTRPQPRFPAGRRGSLADKTWCEFDGAVLRVGKTDAAEVQPIVDALRKGNLVIRAMHLVRPSLEDLFFEAVTDPATGKTAPPGARPPPVPRNA